MQTPGEVLIERELYGASADELLARLRRVPHQRDTVMLIGHNPAIEDLAVGLAGSGAELIGGKFPTGALATLSFSGRWCELAPGGVELGSFVRPKELG